MTLASIENICADSLFATKRLVLGRNRVRRARLYCVGIGKSGTHSIARMFSKTVRAKHEPQALPLLEKLLAWQGGQLSEAEFTKWLLIRDSKMALEVDSSTLNCDIVEILVREFPEARFVLTIRDCYSWCNSLMNHAIRYEGKTHPLWLATRAPRLRPDLYHHASEEHPLKAKGLYTLDGYFSYWTRHNLHVLEKVPSNRLLIVRTDEIQKRAVEIADFGRLPRRALRAERTHEFQNPTKQELLRQIDRDFVEAKVEKHCRPLMARFFPELKSIEDAKL
jgi:hypothetical protein